MNSPKMVFERDRCAASTVAALFLSIGMTNSGRFHHAAVRALAIVDVQFQRLQVTHRKQPLYRVRTVLAESSGGMPVDFGALQLGQRISDANPQA